MAVENSKNIVGFRRAGHILSKPFNAQHNTTNRARALITLEESIVQNLVGNTGTESDATEQDISQCQHWKQNHNKKKHGGSLHTAPQPKMLEQEGDSTYGISEDSQATVRPKPFTDPNATLYANADYFATVPARSPEPPNQVAQDCGDTALLPSTDPAGLQLGQTITRRVFPETLTWRHFKTAQDFHDQSDPRTYILGSEGIEGIFFFRLHETWRCRMCQYHKVQVWFDREMMECPRCSMAKLQYSDAEGNMFRAQGFREAEDGAVKFKDVFLGKAARVTWVDIWDEMLETL